MMALTTIEQCYLRLFGFFVRTSDNPDHQWLQLIQTGKWPLQLNTFPLSKISEVGALISDTLGIQLGATTPEQSTLSCLGIATPISADVTSLRVVPSQRSPSVSTLRAP